MADNSEGFRFTTSSENGLNPALLIAAGSVLPILGIVAVGLRLYSRLRSKSLGLRVDDWLIVVAIFLTTLLGIMLIVGAALHGIAEPTPLPPGKDAFLTYVSYPLLVTEKIFYAFNIVQVLAFGAAKLSVLFFYRRIFRGKAFEIVSLTMVVIVCIWTTGFFFAMVLRCGTHPHYEWAPLGQLLSHCYKSTPMFQAFSISDVVTDLLIISIPIYWVNTLNLQLSKRIAVCGLFMLGFLAIACGIARLVFFIRQSSSYEENQDGIGHLTTEMYWSMIEMGVSVIAACLPTIRLLLGGVTVESVIRSVRSALSLHSNASNSSNNRTFARGTAMETGVSQVKSESIELPDRVGKQWGSVQTEVSSSEHDRHDDER